jgi:hypothetical protein
MRRASTSSAGLVDGVNADLGESFADTIVTQVSARGCLLS